MEDAPTDIAPKDVTKIADYHAHIYYDAADPECRSSC
jgi:aromatic ring-cleaving dioxygenase